MTATTITGVRTVAIPVSDQDAALAFYTTSLGWELRLEAVLGPGRRWIEVAPPGSAVSIALAPAIAGSPAGIDTGIRLAATDVDGEHAALRDRGVAVGDMLRWPGVPPMFTFRDPDGNTMYVVGAMTG
jgi:catechol 2,3-dioxygenase-like lactoylglutathione lyase family enzyme